MHNGVRNIDLIMLKNGVSTNICEKGGQWSKILDTEL